jgi:putative ABC transport system permease protein
MTMSSITVPTPAASRKRSTGTGPQGGSVSARLTRRGLASRKGRTVSLALAIVLGVAFVGAAFILTDSLGRTFDKLTLEFSRGIDLQVRGRGTASVEGVVRDQVDATLATRIAALPGVEKTQVGFTQTVAIFDAKGEVIPTSGPQFGQGWDGTPDLGGVLLKSGRVPNGPNEMAIDAATVRREQFTLGQSIAVQLPGGSKQFELVGTVGTENSEGFAGVAMVAWDQSTAMDVLQMNGKADTIDVKVAPGADVKGLQTQIASMIGQQAEVITGDVIVKEASSIISSFTSAFRTGLLVFAGITLFVSAFIVNNVFSITIGQRMRELALLRAVGATGRQVQRLIAREAFIIAMLATAFGIAASLLVAQLLIGFINSLGGFPDGALVVMPRTIVFCLVVGFGVTMASVILPARKASRIPPVAAMRPDAGFTALVARRRGVTGAVVAIVGALMFSVGLLVRPGGGLGTAVLGGAGAIAVFLGIGGLSSALVGPISRVLGAPLVAINRTAGSLARRNATRSPRRTASTATALTIGIALVTAAALFGQSVKSSAISSLNRTVDADFFVSTNGVTDFPVAATEAMAAIPQFVAATPIRSGEMTVAGVKRETSAVASETIGTLFNLGFAKDAKLGFNDVMVRSDIAKDAGLEIGDEVPTVFGNGKEAMLRLVDTFGEESPMTLGWMVSTDTWAAYAPPTKDVFFAAKLADGADAEAARDALLDVKRTYGVLKISDRKSIVQDFSAQIDTLLRVISILLLFAFLIALVGISITLALSVYERTREIGLMRAVGMDRRQVRRMIRGEAIIVTVFGAIVGVLIGLGMGTVLALAVPDWLVKDISIPVGNIAIMGFAAVAAGLLAALYPSIKASRMNVLDSLAAV